MAREVATKGIDGIGELVIMAPIKPGFIDAYENITYESRLRAVAEALFKIECNAREHEPFTPFADVAERILTVFNFRIGVLDRNLAEIKPTRSEDGVQSFDVEPQRTMFLIATYDGPFEPYLRLIWDPLGPFLDLLLCNCVGYKLSSETGFPEYIAWVRDHLVDSSIFYTTTSNTLRDQLYLADLERTQRELDPALSPQKADLKLAELTGHTAHDRAEAVWGDLAQVETVNQTKIREAVRLAFEALNVLFRLADFYPPRRADADILLRATKALLLGLEDKVKALLTLRAGPNDREIAIVQGTLVALGVTGAKGPFSDHWDWFTDPLREPTLASDEAEPPLEQVQRGLLNDYDQPGFHTTHGLTLLFSITDPAKAGKVISDDFPISWANRDTELDYWEGKPIKLYGNVAFTAPGLGKMKIAPVELAKFPKEFRDGMFQRAAMNGDIVNNHPRRWKFPLRFDLEAGQDDLQRPTIQSEEIDVVLQLRMSVIGDHPKRNQGYVDFEKAAGVLRENLNNALVEKNLLQEFDGFVSGGFKEVLDVVLSTSAFALQVESGRTAPSAALSDALKRADPLAVLALFNMRQSAHPGPDKDPGLRLLAVESTFRPIGPYKDPLPDAPLVNRDHFGFVDGISQPKGALPDPDGPQTGYDDKVPYGDIVYGYRNSRGDTADDLNWNEPKQQANPWLENGSFMVMRKIAQFPERFEALTAQEPRLGHAIVGRTEEGKPLDPIHTGPTNDFTYVGEPKQEHTPFSSHIRLANPRDAFQGLPAPRILRRGMAYGDRYIPGNAASAKEKRGVLFIAYNASIADQYEVIQRWLNRGNSTGVSSAANDPLTGVRQEEGAYTFRYVEDGVVKRQPIAEPLTELQWGLYAFLPSRKALALICNTQRSPGLQAELEQAEVNEGQKTIDRILALPGPALQRAEWKRLLEDFFVKDSADLGKTPPVWRTIREKYDGVLRIEAGIPYGGPPAKHDIEVASDAGPVVLVADKKAILEVMANSADFSSSERMNRTAGSIGSHYVAMDPFKSNGMPNLEYIKESAAANLILFGVSELKEDEVFTGAYTAASEVLMKVKAQSVDTQRTFYKIDFRRIFLANVLGGLCQKLFDIPDGVPLYPNVGHIDRAAWGWQPVDLSGGTTAAKDYRKPRCPADFMSPSRFSFYPRPSTAIQDYGVEHGKGLKAAARKLVDELRQKDADAPGSGFQGQISKLFAGRPVPGFDNDLLTRNILGSMTGAIPPLDANMRGILFEWIDRDSLWEHQTSYLKGKPQVPFDPKGKNTALRKHTESSIGRAIQQAMCKRPAPDLLYRIATRDTEINGVPVKKDEMVILALISPMLASLDLDKPDLDPVFGGDRRKPADSLTHACPARSMVMAILYGMWAALFDAGRIVAQPASLILQITDWDGPLSNEPKPFEELVFPDFPSLDLPEDFEAQLNAKFQP